MIVTSTPSSELYGTAVGAAGLTGAVVVIIETRVACELQWIDFVQAVTRARILLARGRPA
jgi:hypothetical protein